MTTWESFIDSLAARREPPTAEDIAGLLTGRHLAAWLDRELGMLTEEQAFSDISEGLPLDGDGRRNPESQRIVRILLHSIVDTHAQTVTWRILHDAARRCAIRDACREVEAARRVEGWQDGLRAAVDRFDPERASLARQHNAEVGL